MAKDPENMVLVILREIRATQSEHSERLQRLEKKFDDLAKVVTYSLGQTTETQFRQSQQEQKPDELFNKIEKLLSGKEPV